LLKELYQGSFAQGANKFHWDGKVYGQSRIPGTYICREVSNKTILSKKIQIVD